ncbi:MAG: ThuA domain-containing protein [Flavobacteriales bacterium]|jgi:type 1 glutamine amidotransferase|nr:ThuA domain-containing protein [Flavobacteriales bacterium]
MRALVLISLIHVIAASAQPRILHFTKTSGYDHDTRAASFAMFQSIGAESGYAVDDDATGDPFSDPATLSQYGIIVFSNTSGDNILNAQQRANFEQWVAAGGSVLGIHAASDTYRHSSANGGNTGTWDFYAELIGASVQEDPNHVNGTPQYALSHASPHPSTDDVPDPWLKNEEYYYWEGGYYGPDNVEVLRVEETVGPNGLVNTYDAPRPMSWYRELPTGGGVFCTALGHAVSNYTSDTIFREHILDALQWLDQLNVHVLEPLGFNQAGIRPNPADDFVQLDRVAADYGTPWQLVDAQSRVHARGTLSRGASTISIGSLDPGCYLFITSAGAQRLVIAR